MIIVDRKGHLTSTKDLEELLTFGNKIGMEESWLHNSKGRIHFDLTTNRIYKKALKNGAVLVPSRDIITKSWWATR